MPTVKTWLMAILRDVNGMIPRKRFFFNLKITGGTTSVFVIDYLFKVNSSKTTRHANMKLGIIYHQAKARDIRRLMRP